MIENSWNFHTVWQILREISFAFVFLVFQLKWSTKYKKVPILIAELEDGQKYQLVDSSAIISAMYSFLYDKPKGGLAEVLSCYPQVRKIEEETDSKKPKFEIMNRYFLMFQESTPNKDKQKILQGELKKHSTMFQKLYKMWS